MKKICVFVVIAGAAVFSLAAQEGSGIQDSILAAPASGSEEKPFSMGGFFGGVTVDGKNYQMIGLRPEFNFWKIGIGLDITILLDEEGKIRPDDWVRPTAKETAEAYLDKLFYIRFAHPEDPFYFRFGGLNNTNLGYGILVNGYSNIREYPTVKRLGLDIGFETKYVGGQAFIGNFKDIWKPSPGPVLGGRLYGRPVEPLRIGFSFAGDFNEYNGLRDSDGDGYPDRIDHYPNDADFHNEWDYYYDKFVKGGLAGGTGGAAEGAADALVAAGEIQAKDSNVYNPANTRSMFWAADAGFRVIDTEAFKWDIYSQFGQSADTLGWGFTMPGVRFLFSDVFTLFAEYRQTGGKFLFGYYNNTYDIERATFQEVNGVLVVKTKSDRLNNAPDLYGVFAGFKLDLFNVISGGGSFQGMFAPAGGDNDYSLQANISLLPGIIPHITRADLFYIQNNVPAFKFLSESTIMGFILGVGMGEGVGIYLQYVVTCTDRNGDSNIEFGKETNMEFGVVTKVSF